MLSSWLPFLKAQNDRTRAVLDKLPQRETFLKRIQQLSGDIAITSRENSDSSIPFCPCVTPSHMAGTPPANWATAPCRGRC